MSKTRKIEIPENAKVYDFGEAIEVCLNCGGTGANFTDSMEDTCPVCNGTGRVVKKKTVIIDVKPFK